jgi:hypothetical protein
LGAAPRSGFPSASEPEPLRPLARFIHSSRRAAFIGAHLFSEIFAMIRRLTATLLAATAALTAIPAAAQDEAGDKVNMVIVYGEDSAPEPVGNEIVVVARLPEADRFRIPEALRYSDNPANNSWASRVERLDIVGDFGILSCSAAGAGSETGCTQAMIEAAYADRASGSSVRFAQLIEAARQERLATIDEDAAAEQERVEAIEDAYMERLREERDAEVPEATAADTALPALGGAERGPPATPSKDTPFDDDSETAQPLGSQVPARDPRR